MHQSRSTLLILCLFWISFLLTMMTPLDTDYRNLESNGFIQGNGSTISYLSRLDVSQVYTSFDQLIEQTQTLDEPVIIVAKFSRKQMAIYTKDYLWQPPFLYWSKPYASTDDLFSNGNITPGFNTNVYNFSQITFTPLEDATLTIEDGQANYELISNINLFADLNMGTPYQTTDAYFLVKLILFLLATAIMLFVVLRHDYRNLLKEIAVRRLLGRPISNVIKSLATHSLFLMGSTWLVAALIVTISKLHLIMIPQFQLRYGLILLIPFAIIMIYISLSLLIMTMILRRSDITTLLERAKYD